MSSSWSPGILYPTVTPSIAPAFQSLPPLLSLLLFLANMFPWAHFQLSFHLLTLLLFVQLNPGKSHYVSALHLHSCSWIWLWRNTHHADCSCFQLVTIGVSSGMRVIHAAFPSCSPSTTVQVDCFIALSPEASILLPHPYSDFVNLLHISLSNRKPSLEIFKFPSAS